MRRRPRLDHGAPRADVPEPDVLELRVHGVNNTPPAQMLEVPEEDVERARGDALGSFWLPSEAAAQGARARAERLWAGRPGAWHPRPGDWVPPDWVPRGVRREAYSWGAVARYSPGLPGSLATGLVARLSRAAWLAVLPLGVANAAYWARELVPDRPGAGRRYGRGYAGVRLFCLGLTLLLVTAVQTVALDLLATRCLEEPWRCARLPAWLAGLGSFTWTQQLAVMSLVPLAVLGLLQWVAAGASVRYEMPATGAADAPVARPTPGSTPAGPATAVLAQPDLWSRWRLTRLMSQAHVTAGVSLVVLTLTTSRIWVGPGCVDGPSGPHLSGCVRAAAEQPWYAAGAVVAVALLAAAVIQVAAAHRWSPREADQPEAGLRDLALGFSRATLAAAVLLHLAVGVTLWRDAVVPATPRVQGLAFVPATLVLLLLGTALVALTWRQRVWLTWVSVAAVAAVVAAVALAASEPGPWPAAVGVLGIATAAGLPALGRRPGRLGLRDVRAEAWWGGGPGVLLAVALGLHLMLCTLLVVAAGDWLNGAAPAQCLVLADADVAGGTTTCPAAALPLPRTYLAFAATTLLGLGVSAVFLVVVVARWAVRARKPEEVAQALPVVRRPAGRLRELVSRPEISTALARARDRADLAQRAESGLGAVAAGMIAALSFTVLRLPESGWLSVTAGPWLGPVTSVGVWLIGLAWTAAVARLLLSDSPQARPGGLLWDLIGFLPRSAHPFGPPCYAERTVPEIVGRVDAWLTGADLPAGSPLVARRRVVLSAHSMGAVLAVAALMTPPGRPRRRGRVALLTYGTQLRPYFGRFFPELFGAQVLGTDPCRHASFGERPWADRSIPPAAQADGAGRHAVEPRLVDLLATEPGEAPTWTSLWRRTDPLGMAAGDGVVDREAEEVDASGYVAEVATHGGYPRTLTYQWALLDLVDRVRRERT